MFRLWSRKVFCSCCYIDFALQSSKSVNWQKVSLTHGSFRLEWPNNLELLEMRLFVDFKWFDIIIFGWFCQPPLRLFFYLTVVFCFLEYIFTEKRSWAEDLSFPTGDDPSQTPDCLSVGFHDKTNHVLESRLFIIYTAQKNEGNAKKNTC